MIFTFPARIRRRPPAVPVGWCVRLDWPDGTHSLGLYRATETAAVRRVTALRRSWAPGPIRPVHYQVVPISRHDCHLHAHRPGCASPDCPTGAPARAPR